ncbi:23S rRNA (adenine(2030)-N(6))-methyltransferase RlmJ [Glaciecola sp. MH2013]|uniref:23S rRNA (adenine(2030)-N(6))-methyltransferase RlmJ n=1 Tax=Glaciecola sp. MH2013 TaxID=2785524 RepID=UPI0018A120CC|nr:23S rRNA (adenine(2030)-N(6))-methyltransferase RlmJ [Glaciecola sp. MH2013]MBF7072779.1 23S rRNA (adenine(2030)-N(6))-methyltransferase RlmJ [Glaciecola sp. MH2013]
MLSYSHAFHAGNHADVLKHLTVIAILQKQQIKSKPLFYMDTHAGQGKYSLQSNAAKLNDEASTGIQHLVDGYKSNQSEILSPSLSYYRDLCVRYMAQHEYPGSPLVADSLLREVDKGFATELHPQAFSELVQNCKGCGIKVQNRDGFEALVASMPPTPKRGLVLIDPPYEQAGEYNKVVLNIEKALRRWATGVFAIWYPLLSPRRICRATQQEELNPKASLSDDLRRECSALSAKSILDVQFAPSPASTKVGMYGSGMIVINPPWKLEEELAQALATFTNIAKYQSNNEHPKVIINWLKTD